jgi:hypothetical protein
MRGLAEAWPLLLMSTLLMKLPVASAAAAVVEAARMIMWRPGAEGWGGGRGRRRVKGGNHCDQPCDRVWRDAAQRWAAEGWGKVVVWKRSAVLQGAYEACTWRCSVMLWDEESECERVEKEVVVEVEEVVMLAIAK